jgi:hypothetical protein
MSKSATLPVVREGPIDRNSNPEKRSFAAAPPAPRPAPPLCASSSPAPNTSTTNEAMRNFGMLNIVIFALSDL